MQDWLDIGSSPPLEACAQLGRDGYWEQATKECRAYIALLRRVMGQEPTGARLAIKSHEHDFGTYLSVCCFFDSHVEAAIDYAYRCEASGPQEWDEVARNELNLNSSTESESDSERNAS
jgi:hypothetical protein